LFRGSDTTRLNQTDAHHFSKPAQAGLLNWFV